jgi:hypothetical protein
MNELRGSRCTLGVRWDMPCRSVLSSRPCIVLIALALAFALPPGCTRPKAELGRREADQPKATGGDSLATAARVKIEIANVHLPVLEGVVLQLATLTGEMISTRRDGLVVLDDQSSFEIQVQSAEAAIDYADMSRLMNDHVLAYPGAPIANLKITRELDAKEVEEKSGSKKQGADSGLAGSRRAERIELKGNFRKLLHAPFEIEGIPETTPDGQLRIRTTSIQAVNLEMRGVLDLLGLESEDLLGELKEHGIQFDGNDVILHLETLLPPPRLKARVTSIALAEDRMHLTLGKADSLRAGAEEPGRTAPGHEERNQLAFRHGTIRLGRVTMHDADLKIVDLDASDPFDFSFTKMNDQLVKGYAKLAKDGGLTAFAPDAGDEAAVSPDGAAHTRSSPAAVSP